jgi:hypothetical protein
MIPEIGIIVGVYAFIRLCEILTSAESRWQSKSSMNLTKVLAFCALLAVGFLTADLALGSHPIEAPQTYLPRPGR